MGKLYKSLKVVAGPLQNQEITRTLFEYQRARRPKVRNLSRF